jgi:hypothetical protein
MLTLINQILAKLRNLVNDSINTGILTTKRFGLGSTTDDIYKFIVNSPKILFSNLNNNSKNISFELNKDSLNESSFIRFCTKLNVKYELGHTKNDTFVLNVLDINGQVLNSIVIDDTTLNSSLKLKRNNVDIATLNDIAGVADSAIRDDHPGPHPRAAQ